MTADNIDLEHIEKAVSSADSFTVSAFATAFDNQAEGAEAANEVQEFIECMRLLSVICRISLKPRHENGPFIPACPGPDGRSPLQEDLSGSELDVLSHVFDGIEDPELRARLGDILWICQRDHEAGRSAVDDYCRSAERLEREEDFLSVSDRLRRAVDLAGYFGGKDGEAAQKALEVTAEILRERHDRKVTTRTHELIDLLLERRHGDSEEWAKIAEGLAEHLEADGELHSVGLFWSRAASGYQRAKENELQRKALIRHAESYVKQADSHPSVMAKASLIRSAFEAYRQIPNTAERREELHKLFLEYGKQSLDEMSVASTPMDLGDWPEKARGAVRGQEFMAALKSLAMLVRPIDVEKLREMTEKSATDFPMRFLLPMERLNALGRTVGIKPSGLDDPEGALKAQMHKEANRHHFLNVEGLIGPSREQIYRDHFDKQIDDFKPLLTHNAFVPPDRRYQFAKGLLAGVRGDWTTAALHLIPQVENSLRVVLQQRGVITSGLNSSDRRQNEQSLNVTLYDYETELSEIFGSDVIFDLQNLLVEPLGSNLRNEAMHGLMSDGSFYTHSVVYFWWLVLRICVSANQNPIPEDTRD